MGAMYCKTMAVPAVVSLIDAMYKIPVALIESAPKTFAFVSFALKLFLTAESIIREIRLRAAISEKEFQVIDFTHTPASPHKTAVITINSRPREFPPAGFSIIFTSSSGKITAADFITLKRKCQNKFRF